MKPKDLFYWRMGDLVVPALERQGFRWVKSRKIFRRDVDEFEQQIRFDFSKYNEQDCCEFFTMFIVLAKRYPKWFEEFWGEPIEDDEYATMICAVGASSIPGWPARGTGLFSSFQSWQKRKGAHKNYCLRNKKRDEREMKELLEAIEGPLIAYMDRLSSWEGAAEHSTKSLVNYPKACDFYIIAGQEQKARDLIERSLSDQEILDNPQAGPVIEQLRRRREKLAGRGS